MTYNGCLQCAQLFQGLGPEGEARFPVPNSGVTFGLDCLLLAVPCRLSMELPSFVQGASVDISDGSTVPRVRDKAHLQDTTGIPLVRPLQEALDLSTKGLT